VSSLLHPVGPQPRAVYWLRRVVILVILVAAVLLLAHACSGGSPANPGARDVAKAAGSPRPSGQASAAAVPRCRPADLSASLATDRSTYGSGQQPRFTATFHNVSGATCRLVSTAATRSWTVTSGTDTVWSSSGCHLGSRTRTRLTATGTATVSIRWDAHRNDASCTPGAAALPGTYVVRATFGGVIATPAVFHLTS
jgi:hypothetical protein